ncbi:ribonuclease H, partial [Podospora australis]
IVIATDSECVVYGVTAWLRNWAARDWRTSGRTRVQNRDLWEKLSERMGMLAENGCEVSFWRILRVWNVEADQAANVAAERAGSVAGYMETDGVLV